MQLDLDADASAEVGKWVFGVGVDQNAVFANYRVHSATSRLKTALKKDLERWVFPTDLDRLKDLGVGESAYFSAGSSLQARVSFTWSDAISSNSSFLTSLFKAGTPLVLNLTPNFSFSAKATVSDAVRLAISRSESGKLRVAVLKRELDEKSMGIGFSIGIAFDEDSQKAVAEALGQIVRDTLGSTLEKYDELTARLKELGDSPIGTLTGKSGDLIDALEKRVDLGDFPEKAAELAQKMEKFKKDLDDALNKIAKFKAEFGFTYEYQRIESDTSLVEFVVTDAKLTKALHEDVIHFRLDGIRELLPNSAFLQDVQQVDKKIVSSAGFALNIGKWEAKAKLEKVNRLVKIRKRGTDGLRTTRVALIGTRKHSFGEKGIAWGLELKADTEEYYLEPKISDLKLGLSAYWTTRANKINKFVDETIDRAKVYGSLTIDADADEMRHSLKSIAGNKKVSVRHQVKLSHEAMKALATWSSGFLQDRDKIGRVLAAAVPWHGDKELDGRRFIKRRIAIYKPIMAKFPFVGDDSVGFAQRVREFLVDQYRDTHDGAYMSLANRIEAPNSADQRSMRNWLRRSPGARGLQKRIQWIGSALPQISTTNVEPVGELVGLRRKFDDTRSIPASDVLADFFGSILGRFLEDTLLPPEQISRSITVLDSDGKPLANQLVGGDG